MGIGGRMSEKEKYYFKIFACVGVVALLFIGFILWQSGNLPDHGNGADRVREELSGAGKTLDASLDVIDNAERGVDRAEEAVRNSVDRTEAIQERNSDITNRVEESLRLNREGQSIIRQVRERGAKDSGTP